MNLYGAIQKRKSIRSYIQEPLSEAEIEGLVDFISAQNPPEEEIDFVLDRPFAFAIVGPKDVPLFLGIVNLP